MPEHIHIPSDFERLPEYRMLCGALRAKAEIAKAESRNSPCPTAVEAVATHLWMRLWVELTYQARTSNRPGWLGDGRRLFEESVGALFGDDCPPVKLLLEAKVLEERSDGNNGTNGTHGTNDLFCVAFADCNQDKAGNFVKGEKRGQMRSEFVRQEKEMVQNALAMAQLLPPDKYRKVLADGQYTEMNSEEAKAAMLVIQRIDRALRLPVRNPGGYTQGLVADACAVGCKYGADQVKNICFWLLEARKNPITPKTSEQILSGWEEVMVMAGFKAKGQLL